MTVTVKLVLLVAALVCFALAMLTVPLGRFSARDGGFFFVVAAFTFG
jgi:hypothetical protein